MKNIKAVKREEYHDPEHYRPVSGSVYQHVKTGAYVITLSLELEEDEDSQYPLEDILDRFYVNCTDYMELTEDGMIVELEGSLDDPDKDRKNIMAVADLIGKRVYNEEADGRVKLVIE